MKQEKKEENIKKLENKNYFWRVTRRVGGKRKEKTGTCTTKAEAKRACAQAVIDLETAVPEPALSAESVPSTYSEIHKLWITSLYGLSPGTYSTYDNTNRGICRHIGDMQVGEIDLKALSEMVQAMREQNLAVSYINTSMKQVNRVLKYAQKHKYIEVNGVQDFTLLSKTKGERIQELERSEKERDQEMLGVVYSKREIKNILGAVKGTRYEAFVMLGYYMGLRMGESVGLLWEYVDFDAGKMDIVRQLQFVDDKKHQFKGYVHSSVKSVNSHRKGLAIPPALLSYLKDLYAHQQETGQGSKVSNIHTAEYSKSGKLQYKPCALTGFVCCDDEGTHTKIGLSTSLQKYLAKQGIEGFETHSLRKTHTSELVDAGMPLSAVKYRLGHEDAATTFKFYTKTTEDAEEAINQYISNLEYSDIA